MPKVISLALIFLSCTISFSMAQQPQLNQPHDEEEQSDSRWREVQGWVAVGYANGRELGRGFWTQNRAEADDDAERMRQTETLDGKYYDEVKVVPETRRIYVGRGGVTPRLPEAPPPSAKRSLAEGSVVDPEDGMAIWLEEYDKQKGQWVELLGRRNEYKNREIFERVLESSRKKVRDYNAQIAGEDRYRIRALGERSSAESPEKSTAAVPPVPVEAYNPPREVRDGELRQEPRKLGLAGLAGKWKTIKPAGSAGGSPVHFDITISEDGSIVFKDFGGWTWNSNLAQNITKVRLQGRNVSFDIVPSGYTETYRKKVSGTWDGGDSMTLTLSSTVRDHVRTYTWERVKD